VRQPQTLSRFLAMFNFQEVNLAKAKLVPP